MLAGLASRPPLARLPRQVYDNGVGSVPESFVFQTTRTRIVIPFQPSKGYG